MKKNWPVVLIMLLVLLPWAVNAAKFYYAPEAKYSDLAVSHLPNAIYLKDALQSDGEIPLWSNLILSGNPFAADPLAGIWYPPGWLAYFLPQPTAFNLTALLHFLWGGLGMFFLLKRLGLRREAAAMGGLAFLLMPKLFSHLTLGHQTLVYAVSWTPWLFTAELRRSLSSPSTLLQRLMPGALLGVIFLADPRWTIYAAAAWLAFSLYHAAADASGSSVDAVIKRRLPDFGLQIILALGIAAVLLLPLIEFTRLSSRSAMAPSDVLAFSLPPAQLAGLLLPDIGGYAEWQVYPGVLILLLVIYALFLPKVRRKAAFWLVLIGVAAAISLGSLWPFAEKLAGLPGFDLLRVPSRAWFLAGMGLIVTAAYALDALLTNPAENHKPDPMIVFLPLAALAVFLVAGLFILGETPPIGFIWGAAALSLGVLLISVLRRRPQSRLVAAVVLLFVVLDLGGVNWLGTRFRTNCEVMGEGFEAANFIAHQEGRFRVYSPSYSIPQQTAAAEGLELIDGIDPLQLAAYRDFMSKASGGGSGGYSVSIPDFSTGDPEIDNIQAQPDTEMLGLLNGKYVVSAFDLIDPHLTEVFRSGETRVYENLDSLPRAWVQAPDAAPGKGVLSPVELELYTANRVTARAEGPGLAVFSIPDYPGWQVSVDGAAVDKMRIANLLIGVPLSEGKHELILQFQSASLDWGLAISLLAWILMLTLIVITMTRKKRAGDVAKD